MFNHGSGSPFQQQTVITLELKILNYILNSVLGVANIVGALVVVVVSKIKLERLNLHIGTILLFCSTTIVCAFINSKVWKHNSSKCMSSTSLIGANLLAICGDGLPMCTCMAFWYRVCLLAYATQNTITRRTAVLPAMVYFKGNLPFKPKKMSNSNINLH